MSGCQCGLWKKLGGCLNIVPDAILLTGTGSAGTDNRGGSGQILRLKNTELMSYFCAEHQPGLHGPRCQMDRATTRLSVASIGLLVFTSAGLVKNFLWRVRI